MKRMEGAETLKAVARMAVTADGQAFLAWIRDALDDCDARWHTMPMDALPELRGEKKAIKAVLDAVERAIGCAASAGQERT